VSVASHGQFHDLTRKINFIALVTLFAYQNQAFEKESGLLKLT